MIPWVHIRRSGLLILGAACVLGVSGCRTGSHPDGAAAYVRLINAVPDAGGLDVSVDGKRVWKRALYRSSSGYRAVSSGTYPVDIDAAGLGTTLLSETLSFGKNRDYTVLALGQAAGGGRAAEIRVLAEEPSRDLPPGKSGLRLVNAALGAPPIDLVVNNIVGLKSVAFGRRSEALVLDGGHYDLQIAPTGRPSPLLGPVSFNLQAGHSYTLVAMGQASDQSLSLEFFPDRP